MNLCSSNKKYGCIVLKNLEKENWNIAGRDSLRLILCMLSCSMLNIYSGNSKSQVELKVGK